MVDTRMPKENEHAHVTYGRRIMIYRGGWCKSLCECGMDLSFYVCVPWHVCPCIVQYNKLQYSHVQFSQFQIDPVQYNQSTHVSIL